MSRFALSCCDPDGGNNQYGFTWESAFHIVQVTAHGGIFGSTRILVFSRQLTIEAAHQKLIIGPSLMAHWRRPRC